MSKDLTQSARPPALNVKGLQERKLLQAALIGHEAHLQDFTPLRDRIVASGGDANAAYRQLESQRDQVIAELKKLTPGAVRLTGGATSVGPLRSGSSALSFPIAPARFHPPLGPYFGYSGMVQMGRASEGTDLTPQLAVQTTGSIYTVGLDDVGGVTFDGYPAVVGHGPVFNQDLKYIWLHSWNYFIPFPAPTVASTFTYSFEVKIGTYLSLSSNPSVVMSFVSVGDTPNFVGDEILVNADVGWPFVVNLMYNYFANGSNYQLPFGGYVQGRSPVQRSFVVEGGQVPAVALVVGVMTTQPEGSQVVFDGSDFGGSFSRITPGSSLEMLNSAHPSFISLQPDTRGLPGIVNFHYDPLPPPSH